MFTTHYSILDGAAPIKRLFARANEDNQIALAITDHGNMFGVKRVPGYCIQVSQC